MDSSELFSLVFAGKISKADFAPLYFKRNDINHQEAIGFLLQELTSKDSLCIERAVTALFMLDLFDNALSETMCQLLGDESHYAHESIALYLQGLKDPNTVQCLEKGVHAKFKYLDYDDSYDLGRSCIKALSFIGTPEAVEVLKTISANANADDESKESIFAACAHKELVRMKN